MTALNEETEKILKERGLKCICQLCDCGRPHRHKGCRKTQTTVGVVTKNNEHDMESDYKSKFGRFHYVAPVEPIRPFQRPRDPNPPPMDLRTENQMAYKVFENFDRIKPCKLKGEIEKFSDGQLMGQSLYQDSFLVHKIDQVKTIPQPNSFKPSNEQSRNFFSETEYHQNFRQKEKIHQKIFQEKPALSYNLLYPRGVGNFDSIPKKSYKNAIHDGQRGGKVKKCLPYKDNIQLGTDEDIGNSSATTNKMHFQIPQKLNRVKPMRPKGQIGMMNSSNGKGDFQGITQNRSDYRYDESEAMCAKPSRCPEHPSLINLSMDVPIDFKTVKMMSYNNNNNMPNVKHHSTIKKQDRYTPPKEKFEATTTNQDVFQNFGVQPRVPGIRPTTQRKSSAKFAKDSSLYATTFKNPGQTQRVLYDAQYEDNLRLPPKNERFTDTSVMRSSYQQKGVGGVSLMERVKPFKPDQQTKHTSTEPFQGTTQYNEIFKGNNTFNRCVFPKYLAQEEAAKRFATTLKS